MICPFRRINQNVNGGEIMKPGKNLTVLKLIHRHTGNGRVAMR